MKHVTKVISFVSRSAAVDNSFMHVFVGITVANAAVIKGKSCVGVVVWALPLFLCCFAVSVTKRFFFSSGLAVVALWHGPKRDISGEKGGT